MSQIQETVVDVKRSTTEGITECTVTPCIMIPKVTLKADIYEYDSNKKCSSTDTVMPL